MTEPCDKCIALEKLQDERWQAHRREHDLMDTALELARDNLGAKLHTMNDLKAQVDSERNTFLKVSDFDRERKALEQKIDTGRKFMWMSMGGLAAVTFLLQGIILLIEKKF